MWPTGVTVNVAAHHWNPAGLTTYQFLITESGLSLFVIPAYAGIQSFVEKNGYPPSRV